MSSLKELESFTRATKIVEQQLAKNQIKQDSTSAPSLIVKANLQLNEEQYEQEKQKLRSKLSTVMKMNQIEEILNDPTLVNIDNIYIINDMFDKFISDVNKEFKSINFNTFKVLFTQFIKRLAQPNDQEEIMNKLEDIKNILRDRSANVRGDAQYAEPLIDLLDEQLPYVTIDVLDDMQQGLDAGTPTRNLYAEFQNIQSPDTRTRRQQSTPASSSNITPVRLTSGKIPLSFDLNKVGNYGLGRVNEHLSVMTDKINNLTLEQVRLLPSNDLTRMAAILREPAVRNAAGNKIRELAPFTNKWKNARLDELLATGRYTEPDAIIQVTEESKEMFGLGLKTRKETQQNFGAVQINMDKFKNNSILKLTYKNGNSVKEIKATKISDTLKSLISDILQSKKFSEHKFNKLSDDEKHVYKLAVKKGRLGDELNIRYDKLNSPKIDQLKEDWAVVWGQINSGNDSVQLIKKAKELIQQLIEKKLITKIEGLNILMRL